MQLKKSNLFILFFLLLTIFLPAYAKEYTKHVVIISIDGLKPNVLLNTHTPNLNEQWKKGSYSFTAQTIFPSLTLPSHTSMLTGVGFEKHHVDWNDFQPNKSINVKTVFEYAKEKNLSTAAFVAKEKFKHFNKGTSLDYFGYPGYDFQLVLNSAEKYIFEKKPNLSFIHLAEIDGTGHVFGWESQAQKSMLEKMDKPVGVFLKKLRQTIPDVVVIITADHGGHYLGHGTSAPEDMTIPWISRGRIIKNDYKLKTPVTTYDTTATALWLLGLEQPAFIDGKPVKEILDSVFVKREK